MDSKKNNKWELNVGNMGWESWEESTAVVRADSLKKALWNSNSNIQRRTKRHLREFWWPRPFILLLVFFFSWFHSKTHNFYAKFLGIHVMLFHIYIHNSNLWEFSYIIQLVAYISIKKLDVRICPKTQIYEYQWVLRKFVGFFIDFFNKTFKKTYIKS